MGNFKTSGVVQAWQMRKIYAIANHIGIVDGGAEQDQLHAMIDNLFQKKSVKQLSYLEASKLITQLERLQSEPSQKKVTSAQQKKMWALMYQLQSLDVEPSRSSLGERLAGIARKLDIKVHVVNGKAVAQWLTPAEASRLITRLEFIIKNEEKKRGVASG
ncbi:hypothetical protein RyT2_11700 [Pseudolactococcus yaeyamensis]